MTGEAVKEIFGSSPAMTERGRGNDGKKNKSDNDRKRRKSCSGLTRASKKHKAEPHDMYIESNALQQRFVPQPVLRSSWQQLVLENVNRP